MPFHRKCQDYLDLFFSITHMHTYTQHGHRKEIIGEANETVEDRTK